MSSALRLHQLAERLADVVHELRGLSSRDFREVARISHRRLAGLDQEQDRRAWADHRARRILEDLADEVAA